MNTTTADDRAASAVRRRLPWRGLFVLAALCVLVGLGTWQLDRLHWKRALIAEREAGLARPPVVLTAPPGDAGALAFRRVRAEGRFLHDREILIGPRTHRGRAGWRVVTPLRLTGGGIVLVDHGWVPDGRKDPAMRAAGQVAGRIAVEGLARTPPAPGWLTPANVPEKGEWYFIDIAAVAAHLGIDEPAPVIVQAGPAANPGGWPLGDPIAVRIRNDHLEYALTWYALAVALLVIYIIDRRSRRAGPT